MNKRIIPFLFLAVIGFCRINADDNNTPTSPSIPTSKLKEGPRPSNRPNSMVSEIITCSYSNGELEFILPDSIQGGTVIINSGSWGEIFYITAEDSIIRWLGQTGTYTIEFVSDDGRVFSGILTLN